MPTIHGFSVWINREFYTPCFFVFLIRGLIYLIKIMSVRFIIAVEQLVGPVGLLYYNLARCASCHIVAVALESA